MKAEVTADAEEFNKGELAAGSKEAAFFLQILLHLQISLTKYGRTRL